MQVEYVQRWRDKRGSYRPIGETIKVSEYEVAAILDDVTAKTFVLAHHYEDCYPSARRRFGLYRGAELVGVAVFSTPVNSASLACVPGSSGGLAGKDTRTELGRFVLLDNVPANGETYFLARCFASLKREGFTGVISFSDPVARRDPAGVITFPGHVGTIYQALNAAFVGKTKRDTRLVLPGGQTLHRRQLAKLVHKDRGWKHAEARLMELGAPALGDGCPRAYATRWVEKLATKVPHSGKLKYGWALNRRDRRHMVEKPYPKLTRDPAYPNWTQQCLL